jgi:hypothetical protein
MSPNTREIAGSPDDEGRRDTARTEPSDKRANQERINDLIAALGNAQHPLHSDAVNDLVDIGEAAVPALSAALAPHYPWLTSYRAAEALAQIGDGRASGALINALRHPNSNVRWSVVRALSEIGDTRTLLALRRVVHDDHGKTSWGESVSDTAQLALDRLQSRSVLLRFSEPIKTAIVFVIMLAVLVFASNSVQALRSVLSTPSPDGLGVVAGDRVDPAATAEAADATPTPEVTPTPDARIVATVLRDANVRDGPGTQFAVIGSANPGDEMIVLGRTNNDWYRVRLGEERQESSEIQGGEGYIAGSLIELPAGASVPPDAPDADNEAEADATTTATP